MMEMFPALNKSDVDHNPIKQFAKWYDEATASGIAETDAMTLATATKDGRPSARIVLLKDFDDRGFVFFTNYESRKGRELTENPHAALVMHWAELEREICITGAVARLPRAESEAYFRSRPRGARLAAWVSKQSAVVPGRQYLEQQMHEVSARFPEDVPIPEYWGGYVLAPVEIEFWQGRPSRLHDRLRYTRQPDGSWKIERLSP